MGAAERRSVHGVCCRLRRWQARRVPGVLESAGGMGVDRRLADGCRHTCGIAPEQEANAATSKSRARGRSRARRADSRIEGGVKTRVVPGEQAMRKYLIIVLFALASTAQAADRARVKEIGQNLMC